ncbi:unnamed protein product [Effrenium voratum]|nr:unnamed protein product [Effrenium voratum]
MEKPPAPEKPCISSAGSSLRISWKIPEVEKEVTASTLKLRIRGSTRLQNYDHSTGRLVPKGGSTVPAPTCEISVEGCEEGVEYEAVLAVMNSEGWSEPSPFSEPGYYGMELKPREKPPKPTAPTLTALGKGKLRVSWAVPSVSPPVEATQVQLTDVGTGKKMLVDGSGSLVISGRTTFAASRTEVNINGVQDCVEYSAEICCRNAEGFGEYSMASDSVANIDAKGEIGGMQMVIHESAATDVPVMVPQGDGKIKVKWTLPEEAKQTIVKLRRVGNQNWYLCTGGAIPAPASETVAAGLEEGIEYEAMVSFLINNRWCCESAISKPACIGELKLPSPPVAPKVVLAFLGRSDAVGGYEDLLAALRSAAKAKGLDVLMPARAGSYQSFEEMEPDLLKLLAKNRSLVLLGHGMGELGGASAAQVYANASAIGRQAQKLVLLSGYLERSWRPSIRSCAAKWAKQPSVVCPKLLCPGGYLEDGVHDCPGPNVPAPEFPVPSLAVGGELDGVVRVARLAEAWYTQQGQAQHQVKLVPGMSHGDLMSQVPASVATQDLASELGPQGAQAQVARLVAAFLADASSASKAEEDFFQPFAKMFVEEEGSWWWTSNSDERGSSGWAAKAQQSMVSPLPKDAAWGEARNEFRLLSDEELIPPYYRQKHRPQLNFSQAAKSLSSSTVAQLRYVELSVLQTKAGLDGWQIIKEEKAGVLADKKLAIKDDGGYVSAMEIGTKLSSRELAFNVTGNPSSPELDDGDRCKAINEAAYDLALNMSSPAALARFRKLGRPLVMAPDKKPTPPAGPWWIWNYLSFEDKGPHVEVSSWYAFYPLSGPAYGAGSHYCKLLSPARALEWIYTDSLRKPKNRSRTELPVDAWSKVAVTPRWSCRGWQQMENHRWVMLISVFAESNRNKLGTGPFSKESEIGHIGMLAARLLKCTYCFQDFDLQTAEYTRALENFWCPLCRFRHLDPFNAIIEPGGMLRHHMFMRPSVTFSLDLPELKAWRKEEQSIFIRCIKVNSDLTTQVWPTRFIMVANGAEVFRIEPPEEGHVRRDDQHGTHETVRMRRHRSQDLRRLLSLSPLLLTFGSYFGRIPMKSSNNNLKTPSCAAARTLKPRNCFRQAFSEPAPKRGRLASAPAACLGDLRWPADGWLTVRKSRGR